MFYFWLFPDSESSSVHGRSVDIISLLMNLFSPFNERVLSFTLMFLTSFVTIALGCHQTLLTFFVLLSSPSLSSLREFSILFFFTFFQLWFYVFASIFCLSSLPHSYLAHVYHFSSSPTPPLFLVLGSFWTLILMILFLSRRYSVFLTFRVTTASNTKIFFPLFPNRSSALFL